ncbi:MAG: 16S rRNA (guanine(527)-N(7))-methyltransferase RsmG [Burkholderiales bacterium]|nr:16S rRNA (guanine(527)-N(7))-methyltransferase RsmG [Burkholderiales bacterium]
MSSEDHPQRAGLSVGLHALGLSLPDEQISRLLSYLDLISRWNKTYNLTAVRDPNEMLTQHLLDCLAVVTPLARAAAELARSGVVGQGADGQPSLRLLDVGSGAGLPGVVLAITHPEWAVTCVDTVGKKAAFIRQVGVELGLRNLTATHQRVEEMTTPAFHIVTSRAFASLLDFVSLTRERLAPGGLWAAMKAKLSDEERAAVPTDVQMFHVEPLTVPGLDAQRCVVWLRHAPAA